MTTDTPLTDVIPAASPDGDFDLGMWLGRHQAFGTMSGKSAAADIQCLRHIREQKLYRNRTATWDAFCNQYVGASKTNVNRQIQFLEKYGPQFFELTALTRVPPDVYRAIAQHVTAEGLLFEGELIPLLQENSHRISEAISVLRDRIRPPEASNGPAVSEFDLVIKLLDGVAARIGSLPPLDRGDRTEVIARLEHLCERAKDLGAREE